MIRTIVHPETFESYTFFTGGIVVKTEVFDLSITQSEWFNSLSVADQDTVLLAKEMQERYEQFPFHAEHNSPNGKILDSIKENKPDWMAFVEAPTEPGCPDERLKTRRLNLMIPFIVFGPLFEDGILTDYIIKELKHEMDMSDDNKKLHLYTVMVCPFANFPNDLNDMIESPPKILPEPVMGVAVRYFITGDDDE